MKKNNFIRYLFLSSIPWLLLTVNIILLVNYFVMEWDVSLFLIVTGLNMLYNIIWKAYHFKKLDENIEDPVLRHFIGLKNK